MGAIGRDRSHATTVFTALALLSVLYLPSDAVAQPWQYTETRDACADYDPLRRPFFGDLHVHTLYSADAYIFGTRTTPQDAYDFARGAVISLPDDNEEPTRSTVIDRELDFAAVTDHAEFFGEVDLCITPGSPVYDDRLCDLLRQPEPDLSDRFEVTASWLFPLGFPKPPTEHAFCATPGVDCDAAAVSVWQEIQAAAEQAYDRTSACTFTSFIGYEYTASLVARHLHRNVIFRNENVPVIAHSYLDTVGGGTPQGLWTAIETQCLDAVGSCDALIIPHNPNLSGGLQFFDPADAAEAARRQRLEPLVEMHQIKGNSECRFDRVAGAGVGTEDELCTFEQRLDADGAPGAPPLPVDEYPSRNMARNVLKDGLAFEQILGANPFKLGFIGSTDSHNANPGDVEEEDWLGGAGNEDSSLSRRIANAVRENPGGLAVVWAEENARDALFSGLARRETYATSGTRPVVRFFGGDLDTVTCGAGDFVTQAYATGTAMGGDLTGRCDRVSPRFAVWAMKDAGTLAKPGTDLQRVQIVKGWVDAEGVTQEAVFDVAGDANNGAAVDTATCAPTGAGAAELCTVWQDPSWKPSERAFYYVRVLENPSCRWSTYDCKNAGVDPFAVDCAAQAAVAGSDFADCCADETNDSFLSPTVQERAWTSPIWYSPENVERFRGKLRFGAGGGDRVELRFTLASEILIDPDGSPIDLILRDDAEFYALSVPAGTLEQRRPGRFVYTGTGALPGVRKLKLAQRPGKAAKLNVKVDGLDLSTVDRENGLIEVLLEHVNYCPALGRTWVTRGGNLRTRFTER